LLRIITDRDRITSLQSEFEGILQNAAEKHGQITMGYQGGHEPIKASWNSKLGIWWSTHKSQNRFWNAFGVEEPKWDQPKAANNVICEINIPYVGVNRRVAGAFLEDDDGQIYLAHSGKRMS
jgi:hypothetical protein